MKRTTLALIFMFLTGISFSQTQEVSPALEIQQLREQKKEIIVEEKRALKQEVAAINARLERDEIGWEEAERLKGAAAKKRALNIKNRITIIDNQIALLKRETEEQEEWTIDLEEEYENEAEYENEERENAWLDKDVSSRTTSYLVVAAGFNNALAEGQALNDSDFKIGGSRFFEIGISWRSRVFEDSNWLRLKYGFSFQFNGLKPTENRFFVEQGELTVLKHYPPEGETRIALDKSKFRMDNLVFPLFFEFGPSRRVETDDEIWFSTEDKFRIGIGGYAGINLGERQKLKFESEGEEVKRKLKGAYHTNSFIYGLSAYTGFGSTVLYAKYDLNTIFKEPNPELHNISVGFRFDLN